MRSKGTLMPNGALVLGASAIRVKVRRTNGRPPVMQVLVQDVCLPKGIEFPAGSTCVLEANRPHVGAADRITLGPASALPQVCPDWRDLRLMPVDDGFGSTKFRFKVVGPDRRVLAVAEDVRVGEDGGKGEKVALIQPTIRDHRQMVSGPIEVDPEWEGTVPALVLVSSGMRDARARIEANDPEMLGVIAASAIPQIMTRLFVEMDSDGAGDARRSWLDLMQSLGVPEDRIARLHADDGDVAARCRESREVARILTGEFIAKMTTHNHAQG